MRLHRSWLWGLGILALTAIVVSALGWAALSRAGGGGSLLALGQEKSFGLFDPHLHVAVVRVETTARWDEPEMERQAEGRFHRVTVSLRNDAARISIDPSYLKVVALDDRGHEYAPLVFGAAGEDPPLSAALTGTLEPGDATTRTFLFDLPRDTERPVLWITYRDWLGRVLPDHEHGLLPRRILFALS